MPNSFKSSRANLSGARPKPQTSTGQSVAQKSAAQRSKLLGTSTAPIHAPKYKGPKILRFASESQREAFNHGPFPMAASGGFGSSKTYGLCLKAMYLSSLYPGNRGLIARKQVKKLEMTTMKTFWKVCPPAAYAYGSRSDQQKKLVLNNGSEIIWSQLDDSEILEMLRGLEINWFLIDQAEEVSEEIFEVLLRRLGRWDQAEVPQYLIDAEIAAGREWPWINKETGQPLPPTYGMIACLEESTLVETRDGCFVSIKDACENSEEIRYLSRKTGESGYEAPSVWQTRKIRGGVDVCLSAAEISATPEHRFFRFNPTTGIELVRADELKPGDFVPSPKTSQPTDERTDVHPDMAYLLGYTVGDGNIYKRRIQWSEHSLEQVNRIERLCMRLFGKQTRRHRLRNAWYTYLSSKDVVAELCDRFPEIAITGSTRKRVPQAVTMGDSATIANFLSGLFDADGTAGKGSQISYGTTSRRLAHEVIMLLERLGIMSTLTRITKAPNDMWHVSVSGAEAMLFQVFVGFRMKEKNKVFQVPGGTSAYSRRCIPTSRRDGVVIQAHQKTAPRSKFEDYPELDTVGAMRFSWQRVKAVKPHNRLMMVYDITMPSEHNFLANGVMVHNCNPDHELHWIYRRFHERSPEWEETYEAQGYKMIHFNSLDNIFLPDQNRDQLLKGTKEFVARFVKGEWGIPEGQIHKIDPMSILRWSEDLDHYIHTQCKLSRTLDHGESAPTACAWWALDRFGNLFAYREYYQADRLISHHRQRIYEMSLRKAKSEIGGEKQEVWVPEKYASDLADPSIFTPRTQRGVSVSVAEEYMEINEAQTDKHSAIWWQRGDNNELGTRNRINEFLRRDPDHKHPFTGEPGAPRLYFIERSPSYPQGCFEIIRETRSQRRVKVGTQDGKDVFSDERDTSVTDHGYDLCRYRIADMDALPVEAVRRAPPGSVDHCIAEFKRSDLRRGRKRMDGTSRASDLARLPPKLADFFKGRRL